MDMMNFYSMEKMDVHWQKCRYNLFWCRFDSELLNDPRLEFSCGIHRLDTMGVYIIWAGIDNRTILKVGSGIIKSRLRWHLNDPKVQAYKNRGLYATWAPILFVDNPIEKQEGVERYLGKLLNPVLAERFPANVDPIMVNLPLWGNPYQADSPLAQMLAKKNDPNRVKRSLAQMRSKDNNPYRADSPLAQMLAKNNNHNWVESSLDRLLGKRQ